MRVVEPVTNNNLFTEKMEAALLDHVNLFGSIVGEAVLAPPPDGKDINSLETLLGYAIPDYVKSMYAIGNGELQKCGYEYAGLFCGHKYLSLRELGDVYRDSKSYGDKLNASSMKYFGEPDDHYVSFPDATVKNVYFNDHWLTFASLSPHDSYISIDLDPNHAGQVGQVILHGVENGSVRFQLAKTLEEFLEFSLEHAKKGNFNPILKKTNTQSLFYWLLEEHRVPNNMII